MEGTLIPREQIFLPGGIIIDEYNIQHVVKDMYYDITTYRLGVWAGRIRYARQYKDPTYPISVDVSYITSEEQARAIIQFMYDYLISRGELAKYDMVHYNTEEVFKQKES
jgi:hypothetical protein